MTCSSLFIGKKSALELTPTLAETGPLARSGSPTLLGNGCSRANRNGDVDGRHPMRHGHSAERSIFSGRVIHRTFGRFPALPKLRWGQLGLQFFLPRSLPTENKVPFGDALEHGDDGEEGSRLRRGRVGGRIRWEKWMDETLDLSCVKRTIGVAISPTWTDQGTCMNGHVRGPMNWVSPPAAAWAESTRRRRLDSDSMTATGTTHGASRHQSARLVSSLPLHADYGTKVYYPHVRSGSRPVRCRLWFMRQLRHLGPVNEQSGRIGTNVPRSVMNEKTTLPTLSGGGLRPQLFVIFSPLVYSALSYAALPLEPGAILHGPFLFFSRHYCVLGLLPLIALRCMLPSTFAPQESMLRSPYENTCAKKLCCEDGEAHGDCFYGRAGKAVKGILAGSGFGRCPG